MNKKEVKTKNYLNASEREKFLFAIKLYDILHEVIIKFSEFNSLNKEELKNLKTSYTFGSKAIKSVIDRLNPDAQKTLYNSVENANAILVNNFMRQKYLQQKTSDTKQGYEASREYYNLCEITMDMCCADCNKEDFTCDLYRHLEENCIVDMEANYGRCRFAYKKEEV